MKWIKYFKLFEKNSQINKEDLEDIFINLIDRFDIEISISESKSIRLPDDICYGRPSLNDIDYENTYDSINIKLKNKEDIIYDDNFLQELEYSIKKTESYYNLKLGNIYLNISGSAIWFKSFDSLRYQYESNKNSFLQPTSHSRIKTHYIQISFEI